MSSSIGNMIRLTVFGQSHSRAIGMTLEGIPAGFEIDFDELQSFLDRRAPGRNPLSTQRREGDRPEFISGLKNSTTCGAPITALIANTDCNGADYRNTSQCPRPGHADFTAWCKYGPANDFAGGGHFSGRLTAPVCIAGGICLQLLREQGITIGAHISSIGKTEDARFATANPTENLLEELKGKSFPVIDDGIAYAMQKEIRAAQADDDSIGGTIECAAIGVPAGVGEPIFDSIESRIAQIAFGIPAVKGIDFGAGFDAASMRGSQNNDQFIMKNGKPATESNNAGGILGGISTGSPIVFRIALKPTPSIGKKQRTVDLDARAETTIESHGRHDPCIALRAVTVAEAAMALALYDLILESKVNR